MKEMNLQRLIEACPFTSKFSRAEMDSIFDYLFDADYDLNEINIDDFIVNGTMYLSREEYNTMSQDQQDDICIIHNDGESESLLVVSF